MKVPAHALAQTALGVLALGYFLSTFVWKLKVTEWELVFIQVPVWVSAGASFCSAFKET